MAIFTPIKAGSNLSIMALRAPLVADLFLNTQEGPGFNDTAGIDLTFDREDFPYGIPARDWAGIMSEPNLEGIFPIRGFNISSGSHDAIDGWTISLSVHQNYSSDRVWPGQGNGTVFDAAELRLNPPEGIQAVVEASDNDTYVDIRHPDWQVCYKYFRLHPSVAENRSVLIDDDEAPCSGIVSEACIEALEREVISSSSLCSQSVWPDECDVPEFTFALSNNAAEAYRTWDDVAGEEAAADVDWLYGSEMASSATVARAEGEEMDLDVVVTPWDMVMINWVHNRSEGGEERYSFTRSLVCPKSLNTTDSDGDGDGDGDDDDDEDEDDSFGSRMGVPLLTSALVSLIWALL